MSDKKNDERPLKKYLDDKKERDLQKEEDEQNDRYDRPRNDFDELEDAVVEELKKEIQKKQKQP